MSADWTTCRVVRAGGELWGRSDGNWWSKLGYYWPMSDPEAIQSTLSLVEYDPTPVLDAAGQPVVHTVGDLTARHIRHRPQILLRVGDAVGTLYAGRVLALVTRDRTIDLTIDTPCEVLP